MNGEIRVISEEANVPQLGDPRWLRQSSAVNMDKLRNLHVVMAGAGSVGSVVALFLSKMGVGKITVYDPDTVEEHNWSNQMFSSRSIGQPKVTALGDVVGDLGDACDYHGEQGKHFGHGETGTVYICAADGMDNRKRIWQGISHNEDKPELFLDSRMALETAIVYALNPNDPEQAHRYEQTLHEGGLMQEACTARTICYTPMLAASMICHAVKNFVNGEDTPFQAILDLATMNMITEQ